MIRRDPTSRSLFAPAKRVLCPWTHVTLTDAAIVSGPWVGAEGAHAAAAREQNEYETAAAGSYMYAIPCGRVQRSRCYYNAFPKREYVHVSVRLVAGSDSRGIHHRRFQPTRTARADQSFRFRTICIYFFFENNRLSSPIAFVRNEVCKQPFRVAGSLERRRGTV